MRREEATPSRGLLHMDLEFTRMARSRRCCRFAADGWGLPAWAPADIGLPRLPTVA